MVQSGQIRGKGWIGNNHLRLLNTICAKIDPKNPEILAKSATCPVLAMDTIASMNSAKPAQKTPVRTAVITDILRNPMALPYPITTAVPDADTIDALGLP